MEIIELYADGADETHFRAISVAFELRDFSPPSPPVGLSADFKASDAVLFSASGWDRVFHPAPRKQLAVILAGAVTVTATDGDIRPLGVGGCIILNDPGSKGHLTQVQGDASVLALMIAIA